MTRGAQQTAANEVKPEDLKDNKATKNSRRSTRRLPPFSTEYLLDMVFLVCIN